MAYICADKQDLDERFDRVYDLTYLEIRRFVAAKCGDPDYIPDILQEIYLEYYKALGKKDSDNIENDRAFVFGIASKRVKKYYSFKQRMRKILPLSAVNSDDGTEYDIDVPDPHDITEGIISGDEGRALRAELSGYSPEIRKIIYLYYCEEMKLSEIAEATGMKLSTVKNKIYRTVSSIKKKLNKR